MGKHGQSGENIWKHGKTKGTVGKKRGNMGVSELKFGNNKQTKPWTLIDRIGIEPQGMI